MGLLPRIVLAVSLLVISTVVSAEEREVNRPGDQVYLLPNGWATSPMGRQVGIPDLSGPRGFTSDSRVCDQSILQAGADGKYVLYDVEYVTHDGADFGAACNESV